MHDKQKELEKTKEQVKKIVGYATDMISSKFEYKTHYDKYQNQELEYKSLRIELDNPNNFKSKRDKQVSWIHQPPKPGYYKVDYVYPELEKKKNELKTIEGQININRTKSCFAYNRYVIRREVLYSFINDLESEQLKRIIEYFDIQALKDCGNLTSSDMVNIIYKSVVFDIGILFESGIHVDLTDKYIGTITILEILIEHKKICERNINKYINVKQDFNNTEKKLLDSQNLEKELEDKLSRLRKLLFNKLVNIKKIRKLERDLYDIEREIRMLNSLRNFNFNHTFYPSEFNLKKSYNSFISLSTYSSEMIDALGENSLKELLEKINIKINIKTREDNYVDETSEMKRVLKEWFENEKQIIDKLYKENCNNNLENQKILKSM